VAVDKLGELLVGRKALPLEAVPPALEKGARTLRPPEVPELAEGLFQEIRGI
jgi:hypothetical protein